MKRCVCPSLLCSRVKAICEKHGIDRFKLLLDDTYYNTSKTRLLGSVKEGVNGTVDTVRFLVYTRNETNLSLLKLILKAF